MNTVPYKTSIDRTSLDERRETLLDAAETCFVRLGFHRTTMQDIAREAGMSAANIYYYFKSKDVVVLAIAERDRLRSSILMARLEQTTDKVSAFISLIDQHLSSSRANAILRLELWSEANRNPLIHDMTMAREREFRAWFLHTFAELAASPDCDIEALFESVSTFLRGALFSRAVLDPEYTHKVQMAQLRGMLYAGLGLPTGRARRKS